MRLAEYQERVMRVLLDGEAPAADLEALGEAARWQIYRHMARSRLQEMAESAFHRTRERLSAADFAGAFARFLAQTPPRTGLIREATLAFGRDLWARLPEGAEVRDLLAFECAVWELGYRQAKPGVISPPELRELDFEGRPVLNPVLTLLELENAVHEHGTGRRRPVRLLVYRPDDKNEVRWWEPRPVLAEVVASTLAGAQLSLAEAVNQAVEKLELPRDQALLQQLSTDLTLAVERGVLLGVI